MGRPSAHDTRRLPARAGVSLRAYLLLLLFALALFWPLCMGRTLYWGDIVLYFAPMWRWEQQGLQHGHIPLWNPTVLGGQPFVGNPQEGVFYPATLLLPFVPVWLYLSLLTITHVFLCGAFMARYLSRWTRHRLAPIAGGLVYMGSECLIGRVQFPPMIFTAAYFPLLLCSLDGCLDADRTDDLRCSCRHTRLPDPLLDSLPANSEANSEQVWLDPPHLQNLPTRFQKQGDSCGDVRCARRQSARLASRLKLALVVGLLALAAHPQMAYLILACGSVYAFARYATLYRHQPRALRKALTVPLAGLLGLLLTAAQTLPAVQLLLASPREQLTPAQSNRFILDPINLLTLVLPRLRGHPATADFWGGGNAWEPALFIGWLPLLLIVLACRTGWRRKRTRFWVAGALLGLWLSFGSVGGLYWLAFKTVPGLSNFHDPARFLIYTTFAFAFLTAKGWDALALRIRVFLLPTAQPNKQSKHQCGETSQIPVVQNYRLSGLRPSVLRTREADAKRRKDYMRVFKTRLKWILNSKRAVNAASALALLMIALPLWFYGRQWNPTVPHDFLDRRPTFLSALQTVRPSDGKINSQINSNNAAKSVSKIDDQSARRAYGGRVYLPTHDTLWKHYITDGYSDYGPEDDRHLQAFLDTLLPNIGMADGMRSASGYEPVPIAAPAALDGLGRIAIKRGEPNLSRLMALMGADTLLLPASSQVADARLVPQSLVLQTLVPQSAGRHSKIPLAVSAWHSMDVLPPAWIVHSTRRVEGKSRLIAALAAPDFQPGTTALLSDAPQAGETDLEWTQQRGQTAEQTFCTLRKINSDTTDQEYEANSGTEAGLLIVSQAAYPGWKATIDGKPSRLHRVDGALTGVYLQPGRHIVRITYRPDMYRFGLFLTLCACTILCAGVGMWFAMRPLSSQTTVTQSKQLPQLEHPEHSE